MSSEHVCPDCGEPVPAERKELLGIETCTKCTHQQPKPLGAMEYTSKSCGHLIITQDEAEFREMKKPANRRR